MLIKSSKNNYAELKQFISEMQDEAIMINNKLAMDQTPAEIFCALDCALSVEGIAKRFIAMFGAYIRYDHSLKMWIVRTTETGILNIINKPKLNELSAYRLRTLVKAIVKNLIKEIRIVKAAIEVGVINSIPDEYYNKLMSFQKSFVTNVRQYSEVEKILKRELRLSPNDKIKLDKAESAAARLLLSKVKQN